jgi:membrane fusion protein (multidrug efflux system)
VFVGDNKKICSLIYSSGKHKFMWRLISFALILISLLAFSACDGGQEAISPPPPLVGVVKVERARSVWEPEFVGAATGSLEVEVRARVGGILEKRTYQEGAMVKAGTQLFLIDPEPYEIALQKAQAQLAQNQAAREKAGLDNARFSALFKEQAASQKDRDDAAMNYKAALANEQMGKAMVREAQMNLGYTKVTAPIDGIVSKETNSAGTLITTANSLLTTMAQVDPMHINFAFPSAEYHDLREMVNKGVIELPPDGKFLVRIIKPDGEACAHTGKIVFIDSSEDARTSTISAKVELPNPDRELMPGQFVRVRLTGAKLNNVVLIPQQALLNSEQGGAVYIVDKNNVARRRVITLGYSFGDKLQVVEGINEGDVVIVEGMLKVHPDMPVRVAAPAAPAGAAASGQN